MRWPVAVLLVVGVSGACVCAPAGPALAERWNGHPFVFVLMTDDGTKCNLGWAEVARQLDFRFTIAVNEQRATPSNLTAADMHALYADGFEIANHSYSHGTYAVPATCPSPPRGSLLAYFDCAELSRTDAAVLLHIEIDRKHLADYAGIPLGAVRSLAYPRHLHSAALIDSLIAAGYVGARFGGNESYLLYGNGDFREPARNSWDGGISLFRVPVTAYCPTLFGDHSATPPVHFGHEQFLAATRPLIDQAARDGGIFVIYAHHYGDDDDTWGDINYGSGGLTPADLTWIVELVRANDGTIMTFGEAVSYYRLHAAMFRFSGDDVWLPDPAAAAADASPAGPRPGVTLNPAGGGLTIRYVVTRPGPVSLGLYDLRGRRVAQLDGGWRDAGVWSAKWDGRTAQGGTAPSGAYVAHVQSPEGAQNIKVTLLK